MADLRVLFRQKYGADWRWETALLPPVQTEALRKRHIKDVILARAMHYVELWRSHGLHEANRLEPIIAAAVALNSDAAVVRKMKILVLGGCTADRISGRLDLDLRVVTPWADLFFAVRPASGHMSWIFHRVLTPEAEHGDPHFARVMRLAAVSGPDAAELLIDWDREPSNPDVGWPFGEADRLLARQLKWELHFDTALDLIPSTAKEAKVFITAQDDLLDRRARLALASQKLEERVREAAREHQIRSLRLEAQIAREHRLAAEAAEQTAARAARADERAERKRKIRIDDLIPTIPRIHRANDRTA